MSIILTLRHDRLLTVYAISLKNYGAEEEVSGMFELAAETMALPLEEKMKFSSGSSGMSHGCVKESCCMLLLTTYVGTKR